MTNKGEKPCFAVIAGSGAMPAMACSAAKRKGFLVLGIRIEETGDKPPRTADVGMTASLLEGEKIVNALTDHNCRQVMLCGKFDKKLHGIDFSKIDSVSGAMLMRLQGRADMDIGRVVLEELESRGFEPADQMKLLDEFAAPKGMIAGKSIEPEQEKDIRLGLEVARAVAKFDIGQTIAISNGLVLAVEAAEHTNKCILRAGKLSFAPITVVKVARPDQDFRFDTPAIGTATLNAMKKAGANVLAVEAGRTLILDRAFTRKANELDIRVIGV